ncbi:MAG TPA: helix-turn-helix domain-containing protein [Acidimicrobiales bacterium]|nr:helix-turn-helix domain-containing protein [Acidimicrobiales bacterium]
MGTTPTKRSYNSARRAQQAAQTRADVVAAAIELFSTRGWGGTTLAAVAEAAGVSVETIYNGFGSKTGLLRAAADASVTGDTDPVPLAERPEFQALGEGTLDERIERGVALMTAIHERTAGVWQAIIEAASGDDEVDGWRLELEAGRQLDVGRSAEVILGRPTPERLRTVLWLLYSPEGYRKLVADEGMSPAAYRDLMTDVTRRLAAAFP